MHISKPDPSVEVECTCYLKNAFFVPTPPCDMNPFRICRRIYVEYSNSQIFSEAIVSPTYVVAPHLGLDVDLFRKHVSQRLAHKCYHAIFAHAGQGFTPDRGEGVHPSYTWLVELSQLFHFRPKYITMRANNFWLAKNIMVPYAVLPESVELLNIEMIFDTWLSDEVFLHEFGKSALRAGPIRRADEKVLQPHSYAFVRVKERFEENTHEIVLSEVWARIGLDVMKLSNLRIPHLLTFYGEDPISYDQVRNDATT